MTTTTRVIAKRAFPVQGGSITLNGFTEPEYAYNLHGYLTLDPEGVEQVWQVFKTAKGAKALVAREQAYAAKCDAVLSYREVQVTRWETAHAVLWINNRPEGVPMCEWFAACDNPAGGTVPHSILGPVPVCPRCAARFDLPLSPLE